MTCLEAQSNIMAFIDKKLNDDNTTSFVRHVKHCPNCSEELEIYYTLIVGMRQLDNNEELSHDFKKDLNDELTRIENKIKNAQRFKFSTFGVVFTFAIIGFFIFYSNILTRVYKIEQNIIKVEQGEHYFYKHFADYIELYEEDVIIKSKENNKPVEKTIYDRIHSYNIVHPVWYEIKLEEENNE